MSKCLFVVFVFRNRLALCIPGCPGTLEICLSAFQVLGLRVCTTMPSCSSKSLVDMSSHWKKQTPQTEPILFVALWRRSESALFRLASPMTQGGAFTNPGTCLTPRDNKERVCNCGSQSAGASCVTSCYGLRGKV